MSDQRNYPTWAEVANTRELLSLVLPPELHGESLPTMAVAVFDLVRELRREPASAAALAPLRAPETGEGGR